MTADLDVQSPRYRRFAWAFLAYTVGVILWGTFVRATLSGDGCGAHWPLCNGEVVPVAPTPKMIIELAHRLTSGLALILAVVGAVAARRAYPRGHRVRRSAALGLVLMGTEALVGAALVLFRMVADNPAMARAPWMALHLTNTFLLLVVLTLNALWASGRPALRLRGQGGLSWLLVSAMAGTLCVAMTGAVAALGDTLFPAMTLEQALAADLSPAAHLFIRLRTLHPLVALVGALLTLFAAGAAWGQRGPEVRRPAVLVGALLLVQLGLGLLNVLLLAPVWMQLLHLAVADLLWIALTVLTAASLPIHSTVTAMPSCSTPREASSPSSA